MKGPKKGSQFENKISHLLRLMGYSVANNEHFRGTQIDIIASKDNLLSNLRLLVECTDRSGPVGIGLVKEKSGILTNLHDPQHINRLLMVSRSGYTAEAKEFASDNTQLILLTDRELEARLLDFQPYFDWYVYNYSNSSGIFHEVKLYEAYVDVSARADDDELVPSLITYVTHWLEDKRNNLLFVLGEYGSGKTSFCRHFTFNHILAIQEGVAQYPHVPILINLRDVTSRFDLKRLIVETLTDVYGVQLPSFLAFEHLCTSGNVLLLLDGFDEMSKSADKRQIVDAFKQIYLLATLEAKIILTSRSNFFRSHEDTLKLMAQFSMDIPVHTGREESVVELSFANQGKTLYVEKFNADQVHRFIERRFGERTIQI